MVTLETSTSSPAPSNATTEGLTCSALCRTKPTRTRASTTMLWTSSVVFRMALRSESAITSATRASS